MLLLVGTFSSYHSIPIQETHAGDYSRILKKIRNKKVKIKMVKKIRNRKVKIKFELYSKLIKVFRCSVCFINFSKFS